MENQQFKNKVAVVTGSSGGIGKAITGAFVNGGAQVVCVDIRAPQDPAPQTHHIQADVGDFSAVGRCVQTILDQFGRVDFLINNAGISRAAPIWKMTEEQWDTVLQVNLKGAYNFIHHLAPHFRAQKSGKIVNVASINGQRGKFGLANYSAAKAGLIGLTKTVAKELGRDQVNVNAVAPGFVLTPLTQDLPADIIEQARAETVLQRLATPEDIAQVILFLCSPAARHITGEIIKVDGGQYI